MTKKVLVAVAFLAFVLTSNILFAQTSEDLSGIAIQPSTDPGPQVDVELGFDPINPRENIVDLPTEWARFAGGVWAGTIGQGVFGTFPRISSDDAFVDSKERGLGMGVQVDLGVKHSVSQAIRFRVGYASLGLNPDTQTLQKYSFRELEGKIKIVHVGAMYRWIGKYFPVHGVLWAGVGVSANYVASSEPKDPDVAPKSELRNTLGLGYQVAVGWDYPIIKYTDLGAEFAYHPFRAFSALLSLRTSL
jgi:hypothetical protein